MKNKKGFTLVEVIVVVALIAVVAMLMYSFFGQGLKVFSYESDSADKQMNLREVVSDITSRIRLTDSSSISYSSGTLTIGSYSYTLSNGQIKRNGAAISSGISSFNVSMDTTIVNITIVNTAGTSISTSVSLLEQ